MKRLAPAILLVALCSGRLHAIEFVGDYRSHRVDGSRVVFDCAPATVTVAFCAEDIVKVSTSCEWSPGEDSSLVVLHRPWPGAAFAVEEDKETIRILSRTFEIRCSKYPFRVSFYRRSGEPLLRERPQGGIGWERPAQYAYFTLSEGDHFYGLGMRAIDLDRRGWAFDTYNRHGAGEFEHPTMGVNIPFVVMGNGAGVYFDNTWTGRFDLGKESPGHWYYRTDGGKMVYYLIDGPGMKDVLEKYTWLTGRQPLPPRWAFGLLQSKFGYVSESDARGMIETMRKRRIPCDAIILDLYWFGQPSDMGRLSWNLRSWPDPAKMIADFRALGFRTILIEEPYVTTSLGNFMEGAYRGCFGKNSLGDPYVFRMWAGMAGLVDFTNPDACRWWWSKHEPLVDQGVAGWWTDLGEPETHPGNMVHRIGSAARAHNVLNLLWSRTVYEGCRAYRPEERVFILTRSGYAGMQRYGAAPWSGDVSCTFKGLANQLPILLGMSLSGVSYQGSDIGGFSGNPSRELYARWMEFGTFSPVTRPHGVDHTTEPWGYGSRVEEICRNYITLRYRLLPYLYTMAYRNSATGLPLARPLVLEYPDDPEVANMSSEYLWGDAFLVAPVVEEGATKKRVYLPRGEWIDYWTKRSYAGGYHTVEAPIETLPLFVRAGAIVPMGPAMEYSDQRPLDTLTLDVYPSGFSSTILYEDDGRSYDYEIGAWDTTRYTCEALGESVVVTIGPATGGYSDRLTERIYLCRVNGAAGAPDSVLANGRPLPTNPTAARFDRDAEGWRYDGTGRAILVKIATRTNAPHRIDIKGFRTAAR